MKILHLQLEDETHRKLKLISMNSDMSMKDTVVDLINKKWDTKKAPLSDFPDYKQEYTAPPKQLTPAVAIDETPTPQKKNSVGKPKKICPEHLCDPDVCKLMKHTGAKKWK